LRMIADSPSIIRGGHSENIIHPESFCLSTFKTERTNVLILDLMYYDCSLRYCPIILYVDHVQR
ncbi:hypothetical protein ACK11X_19870, partial [Bacillus velezensis]|uniref:hypothetical protein n=1 Tax=Bacillus velezensis TaxID=492670 RepID=UPI003CEBF20C